jgi:MinD-like ATPase involved in chromosome partitioning or flagellar assembly
MQILLLGAGGASSRLNLTLCEHDHVVTAQLAAFTPQHLDLFDFQAMVVVSPEASVTPEGLTRAAERGVLLFIVAGAGDGLAAWARAAGLPAFAYPPSEKETGDLLLALRRAAAWGLAANDQYRRAVLGGDLAARLGSSLAVRKIAVTSPKGGTGKTTIAVNLAVALALSGFTTYLVDADANAGALAYHLRLGRANATLIGLLRRELDRPREILAEVATGAAYLQAFTPLPDLPTLRVLPGLVTDDLSDQALEDEERITQVLKGLYEAGVAAGGVVVVDVGNNPAHAVHRAALRIAEGIAIVIRPEIPDLAETRRWLSRMVRALAGAAGNGAAVEFIGSRVKVCYNMALGDDFKTAQRLLSQALGEERLDPPALRSIASPGGVIPYVDPRLATQAVNSDRRGDILIWRYRRERLEELAPFAEALLSFAAHFVPAISEGARRIGLLNSRPRGKRRLFSLRKG